VSEEKEAARPADPVAPAPPDAATHVPAAAPAERRRRVLGLLSVPEAVALGATYLGVTVLTHYRKLAGVGALALSLLGYSRILGRLLGGTLVAAWRRLDAERTLAPPPEPGSAAPARFDLRPLVVLVTVAVSLTLIEYYGDRDVFERLSPRLFPKIEGHRYAELFGFAYWSAARFVGYVVLPWIVCLAMGMRLRDFGLSARGITRHLWIYIVLFLLVLPPVVMVSYTQSFQATYPFYKLSARSWTDYLVWEALYGFQFFALEVFFRGFIVHSLRPRLGSYAVFVMAVPYCMIHYHKPIPEVLGAIATGIVLGTLSLVTRSIWCGVLIHLSVAWSMDLLALSHTSGLPGHSFVTSD
jgi:uncharacterized protein